MRYRKFKADLLFDGEELLDSNNILITNETGVVENIVAEKDAGDNVEIFNGVLSPGFINCHCHLELSHMKGLLPEKSGLVDFVFNVVTQRHFQEEDILQSIKEAEEKMLQNGIVAVGDICNNTLTLQQKKEQRLTYYNFIEASGWLENIAATRFERALTTYNKFTQQTTGNRQQVSMVPHAPYSVSNTLWNLLEPGFENKIITIHNQETVFEDELFLQASGDFLRMYQLMNINNPDFKASGKSSLQTYFPKLKKAKNVLLVHNTFTKEEDIYYAAASAKKNGQLLWWCLCVNANVYIENALPPVALLLQNNCSIVLGTDSLASNHSLSILDEMKTIQQHFPDISLTLLLQWATLNGARALNLHDMFGSFEKGKQPGVVLISELSGNNISGRSAVTRII